MSDNIEFKPIRGIPSEVIRRMVKDPVRGRMHWVDNAGGFTLILPDDQMADLKQAAETGDYDDVYMAMYGNVRVVAADREVAVDIVPEIEFHGSQEVWDSQNFEQGKPEPEKPMAPAVPKVMSVSPTHKLDGKMAIAVKGPGGRPFYRLVAEDGSLSQRIAPKGHKVEPL